MKKFSAILIASSLTACAPVDSVQVFDQKQAAILLHQQYQMHPTRQMIKLSLPKPATWQRIDLSQGTLGTPVMLIPNQEYANDWTQSIRTQIRGQRHDPDITAGKFVQELIILAKQQCASTEATILASQPQFTEYKIIRNGCETETDELQVGKAFNGTDAVYLVYYTAKTGKVSLAQIKQNMEIIKSAKLISRPDAAY